MACKGHVDVVVLWVKHNADANVVRKIATRDGHTAVLDLLTPVFEIAFVIS